MTEPTISVQDRQRIQELRNRYPEALIDTKPIFAGFAGSDMEIPFAFHVLSVETPRPKNRFAFHRDRLADSISLAELELAGVKKVDDQFVYRPEVLSAFLPEKLRNAGWQCVEATARIQNPRNIYSVTLSGPNSARVSMAEMDEDVLYVLEDAAWCAEHGLPGFRIV